jgi:hypothetical protein
VERIPIAEADRENVEPGDFAEQEYPVVLHAERPVVTTEVVATEGVAWNESGAATNRAYPIPVSRTAVNPTAKPNTATAGIGKHGAPLMASEFPR